MTVVGNIPDGVRAVLTSMWACEMEVDASDLVDYALYRGGHVGSGGDDELSAIERSERYVHTEQERKNRITDHNFETSNKFITRHR